MLPRCLLTLTLVAPCVLAARLAGAQVPAGGDFLATAYTTGYQVQPRSAMAADGRFVVVWTDSSGRDGQYNGIFGQLFDAAGTPHGADFRVNSVTTGYQGAPVVGMAPTGDFVVAWEEGVTGQPLAQRYDRTGRALGGEFQVNTYTTFNMGGVSAAMAPDGRFVMAWHGGLGDFSVYARVFDASGRALGPEFVVSSAAGFQGLPAVATDAAGNFAVAWWRGGDDIYARRFTATGQPRGPELHVETAPGQLEPPSIGMAPGGEFVVAWSSLYRDGDGYGVAARLFDAAGTPLGADFAVNTFTSGNQFASEQAVSLDAAGAFTVLWTSQDQDGSDFGIFGQRFAAGGQRRGGEFQVNAATTGTQAGATVAGDGHGNFAATWIVRENGFDVIGRRFGGLFPAALAVDGAGNGVLEPGESVEVRPTWRNTTGTPQGLLGALTRISGPAGADYAITDAAASYGLVANGAAQACTDCYTVSVSAPAVRPAAHWDAAVLEGLTPAAEGQQSSWPLHVGRSFADVAPSSPFYRYAETLLHRGITAGCDSGHFCPGSASTRGQVAAFVLAAAQGPAYAPPACGAPVFGDVPASSPYCRWVEELARRGVASGCGGTNFCPNDPVTREQMAVFLLRTLDPALSPPACTTPMFGDVPATSPFCRWVEELARRGITAGCGGGNYCPTQPVTREQMAVFLTTTFGLTLYGP